MSATVPALLIGSAIFCGVTIACAITGGTVVHRYSKKVRVAHAKRIIPMSDINPQIVYLACDPVAGRRVINVLDRNKQVIYTFKRVKSKFRPKDWKRQKWEFVMANNRAVVATLLVSPNKSCIKFNDRIDMPFRMVKRQHRFASKYQYFRSREEDTARYRWTRSSLMLEKVMVAKDAPHQRCKQSVAMARNLDAPYSLVEKLINKSPTQIPRFVNYEIQYDRTCIDRELLLTTGFISIMTQWRRAGGIKLRPMPKAVAGQDRQRNVGLAKRQRLQGIKIKFAQALATSKGKINELAVQKVHEAKLIKISVGRLLGKQLLVSPDLYYQESLALASCQH